MQSLLVDLRGQPQQPALAGAAPRSAEVSHESGQSRDGRLRGGLVNAKVGSADGDVTGSYMC